MPRIEVRIKNAFGGSRIDDLLGEIRKSSAKVKVCSECILDKIHAESHNYVTNIYEETTEATALARKTSHEVKELQMLHTGNHHNLYRKTTQIQEMAQDTSKDVHELRKQISELGRSQKSLLETMDAISGKNGLFQFLMEHSSMSIKLSRQKR